MDEATKALELAGTIISIGIPLTEELLKVIALYKSGAATESAAEAAFQSMMLSLKDPHGDAKALNAEIDAELKAQG